MRACGQKGFGSWLQACGADIVCLQETRATPDQLPDDLRDPPGWHVAFRPAERLGYSGVAILARQPWDELHTDLGDPAFDSEGRLQLARFGRLWVAGVYFPNGNGKERDNSRVPYKLAFYQALQARLQPLADAGEPVVVIGDWNTAPAAIDLARPKDNEKTSGYLPEERAEVARWLALGWVDAFRHQHPTVTGAYSWWSQRFGVRAKNVGWRIDLSLVSPTAAKQLSGAGIAAEIQGSDHCPIWLDLAAYTESP